VAFIGSLDLSIAAGAPGDEDAPAVRALVDRVAAAAQRTGRHLGVFAGSVGAAQRAAEAGYRYIAVSSDLAMLRASARDLLAELREARRA
jgi:2-keto-3-deoxy-L-rhamnonate aldolase RhmA